MKHIVLPKLEYYIIIGKQRMIEESGLSNNEVQILNWPIPVFNKMGDAIFDIRYLQSLL